MNKVMVWCVLAMVLSGCASNPANTTGVSLEAAVQEAARQMDSRLPASTKVALVSVGSSSARLSEYVINLLEAALVISGKLVVVDRANLDKIRMEQGFQLSGDVSDESAKAIGQLLGAGAIVTGSFTDLGDAFNLTIKAINMETAAVVVSYPADVARSARIEALLASGGGAGTGAYSGTARPGAAVAIPAQAPAPAPAAPTPAPVVKDVYTIGETGPAGGFIFYDKGNNSGGWRYLEAAPASTETKVQWGAWGIDTGVKKTGIGDGKDNTRLILAAMNQLGEAVPAIQYCVNMNFGGYRDWFLPSKAELNLMYSHLRMNGAGGFKNDYYLSSSEDDGRGVWTHNFSNGFQGVESKTGSFSVRAVRQF